MSSQISGLKFLSDLLSNSQLEILSAIGNTVASTKADIVELSEEEFEEVAEEASVIADLFAENPLFGGQEKLNLSRKRFRLCK